MRPAPDLLARRLLFFTGKGGVGKSTVTAATALLAAEQGQRVLVVEADDKGAIPGNFEQPSVGFEPREVYPGVCAMAMRTEDSLKEYLKLDDPELLDVSYNYFTGANLNRVPDPGREGARRYLTEGPGASDPRAAGVPLDDYFDLRFVERVQASGFVQQLYGADR